MSERWKLRLGAALFGALGMLLAYGGVVLVRTAYQDHLAIQAMDAFLGYNLRQGRLQAPQPPAPPPPPPKPGN